MAFDTVRLFYFFQNSDDARVIMSSGKSYPRVNSVWFASMLPHVVNGGSQATCQVLREDHVTMVVFDFAP